MQYGTRVSGFTKGLREDTLLEVGKTYQINIKAEGIAEPEIVAEHLLGKLATEYPEMRVNWVDVSKERQTIKLQFTTASAETLGFQPRSLTVGSVIAWLPTVLILIGVIVTLVSLLELYRAIPWYVWGGFALGIILIFWGPSIAKKLTAPLPKKYRPKK